MLGSVFVTRALSLWSTRSDTDAFVSRKELISAGFLELIIKYCTVIRCEKLVKAFTV